MIHRLILTLALSLSLPSQLSAWAQPAAVATATTPPSTAGQVETLTLSTGTSQVVSVPRPYAELRVADPAIADVLPVTPTTIYVVGKATGATTVSAYSADGAAVSLLRVAVGADAQGLQAALADLMPGETGITVRGARDSLVLSGIVSDGARAAQAMALAEAYAPGKTVNLLGVAATQQVMLEVRFSEMQRSAAKNLRASLGLNTEGGDVVAESGSVLGGGVLDGSLGDSLLNPLDAFGAVRVLSGDVDLLLDALEERGLVKTLAEPTLVALSGDTASFLAGGEFPIPIAQSATSVGSDGSAGAGAISVDFKEFGVGLSFTPTVLGDGLINLVVAPEVSSIAPASSISINGLAIPGLKTRRARTTVELRDGQTFAIAGLIRSDYEDAVRQLPWAGDLPVIGALFRSTSFQKDETELVITVTPRLVRATDLPPALPTDSHRVPSEAQLFLGLSDPATTLANPAGALIP